MSKESELEIAQSIVVVRLKQKLGDDAHLLDRLISTRGKRKGFLKKTPPRCGTEEELFTKPSCMRANHYQCSMGRMDVHAYRASQG